MIPAERLAWIRVYIANGGRASWPRDADPYAVSRCTVRPHRRLGRSPHPNHQERPPSNFYLSADKETNQ